MKSFVEVVKEYSSWKLQEKGNGKVTRDELNALRESFKKQENPRATKSQPNVTALNKALKEKMAQYRNWKIRHYKGSKLTENELKLLKKAVLQESKAAPNASPINWKTYLANYKKFKELKEHTSKITYKELKLLKENFTEALAKKIRLREADAGFDPTAAAPQAGDPNALADPTAGAGAVPGAEQDPMAMQGAIDQAITALTPFSQSGANPLAGDPAAGLPPVDGTQPPAGAPPPPLAEAVKQYRAWKLKEHGTSKITQNELKMLTEATQRKPKSKFDQIKERIAARNAKLAALQENGAQDLARKELGALGLGGKIESNSTGKGSTESGEELVKVPAAGSLANGYSSGEASKETKPAKTWPTKAVGKEAGGALQGAGASQSKIKESEAGNAEECEDDVTHEEKLTESKQAIKNVTDTYVERYFEPKLSFDKLKEAMASGLLG